MKNFVLLSAAMAFAGFGFAASADTLAVATNGTTSTTALFGTDKTANASQVLYPASELKNTEDVTITAISFNQLDGAGAFAQPLKVTLSMANTTANNYNGSFGFMTTNVVPADEMTAVFSGSWTPMTGMITFELDTPFTIEAGKSLALNITVDNPNAGSGAVSVSAADTTKPDGSFTAAFNVLYTKDATTDFYANVNSGLDGVQVIPATMFTYGEGGQTPVQTIDLKAEAGENWPAEAEAGKAVNFPLVVENVGEASVASYTAELLDYTTDQENPAVIATVAVNEALAAGASNTVNLPYTFDAGGMYFIGARVVVEGDKDLDNNTIEPDVVEVPLPAVDLKAVAINGETKAEVGKEYEYTVEVYNGGEERVSSFQITIKTEEGTVLVTETAQATLMSMSNGYFALPVTFTQKGTYHLVGEVKVDDDADETNNVTPVALTVEVDDNMDGVENILIDAEDAEIYNLQGVRVSNRQNLPAGIYVVGGKKVVVK